MSRSILDQLGIEITDDVNSIVSQLEEKLRGRISDDKLEEIIQEVVRQYSLDDNANDEETNQEDLTVHEADTIQGSIESENKINQDYQDLEPDAVATSDVENTMKKALEISDEQYEISRKNGLWNKIILGLTILLSFINYRFSKTIHLLFNVDDFDLDYIDPTSVSTTLPLMFVIISLILVVLIVYSIIRDKNRRNHLDDKISLIGSSLSFYVSFRFFLMIKEIKKLMVAILADDIIAYDLAESLIIKYAKHIFTWTSLLKVSLILLIIALFVMVYSMLKNINITLSVEEK